jgi:hypothetical protein
MVIDYALQTISDIKFQIDVNFSLHKTNTDYYFVNGEV